jgi:hypothetical protein
MAAPPPGPMDATSAQDILNDIALHVVLPPRLPTCASDAEHQRAIDTRLSALAADYAAKYGAALPAPEGPKWERLSRMLRHLSASVNAPIEPTKLKNDLIDMHPEGESIICAHMRTF